jgi:hypothetical protein
MKTKRWMTGIVCALALAGAKRAEAQVFTPSYLAPRVANEVGLYLSDGPGDLAGEGILRRNFGGTMLGLRAGVADIGDTELLVGGELLSPISVQAPVELGLTAGAQGVLGDADAVGLSVGLDVGATFQSPGLAITPYVHPRLGFINGFGPADDFDLDLLADLGVNVDFAQGISLRLGIGLSDVQPDWGLGIAWRQ